MGQFESYKNTYEKNKLNPKYKHVAYFPTKILHPICVDIMRQNLMSPLQGEGRFQA